MRDIVWTVIIIWVVWKIYDAFTTFSKPRPKTVYNQNNTYQQHRERGRPEGSVNIDNSGPERKSHFKPDDGEYVDFEEVK